MDGTILVVVAGVVVVADIVLSPARRLPALMSLGGILPMEAEYEGGADAGEGSILVVAVVIDDGRVTAARVEVLQKSGGVEVDSGLDVDADTEVEDNEGAVVALGGMSGAGVGRITLLAPGCDTRALDSPKLVKGL